MPFSYLKQYCSNKSSPMRFLILISIFECISLLLVAYSIQLHYSPLLSNSFYHYNDTLRIVMDILLLLTIFIRLKDLVLNKSHLTLSYKSPLFHLLAYITTTALDIYYYLIWWLFGKVFFPLLVIYLFPILILIIRIIYIKQYSSTQIHTDDILDNNIS